ncbi:Uncharacterised protein [Chlamydia trachomatis]|nr:Uncharacterised protein [Chlamydia trachomatis]
MCVWCIPCCGRGCKNLNTTYMCVCTHTNTDMPVGNGNINACAIQMWEEQGNSSTQHGKTVKHTGKTDAN